HTHTHTRQQNITHRHTHTHVTKTSHTHTHTHTHTSPKHIHMFTLHYLHSEYTGRALGQIPTRSGHVVFQSLLSSGTHPSYFDLLYLKGSLLIRTACVAEEFGPCTYTHVLFI